MDEKEISQHRDILAKIEANSDSINDIHTDIRVLKKQIEPVADFVSDVNTAARLGRGIRALVGWVVVVGGAISMIWIVVSDAINHG